MIQALISSSNSLPLVAFPSSVEIRRQLPSIEDQLDYHYKLAALKEYAKDREWSIANLEAQVALAETLNEAVERGDAQVNERKQYEVLSLNTALNANHVHLWRRLAAIPFDRRGEYYGRELRPSRNGLLRWWDQSQSSSDSPPFEPAGDLPLGPYGVILADPPWRYRRSTTPSRQVGNHYDTLDLNELMALEVPAAKDCVLFLWATAPKLAEALQLVDAWGFGYRTGFVWIKNRVGLGHCLSSAL